jgi:hypothetical protein
MKKEFKLIFTEEDLKQLRLVKRVIGQTTIFDLMQYPFHMTMEEAELCRAFYSLIPDEI